MITFVLGSKNKTYCFRNQQLVHTIRLIKFRNNPMTTFIEWIFNWNTSTLVLQSTDINIKINKKNIAGQVLKNNSKNWMKNSDVLYLTSRSIERCQPEHKQNHQKIKKQKESKLNKNILIAKTLEAFEPKANFFPLKIPMSKTSSKPILRPEKYSLALEDRLNRRWTKNFKKSIANHKENVAENVAIEISSESIRCL